ncbi:MAG: hypothetical protein GY717_14615 [Rhodobacteraceae bacterium]|nr:hypothetical protein [Paracoccaceae bacterium]
MKRPRITARTDPATTPRSTKQDRAALPHRLSGFARDEDGAMIIFGIMMFGVMLAIGGLAFDLMRFEAHRERLQSTLDRAVLAAASLGQSLEPGEVVIDYFAKAGMSEYIDEDDIIVTEGINSRRVEATANINVPMHHGGFWIFGDGDGEFSTLAAEATSTAEESIGNVEISLVLDVSGSMNSYTRLSNLKNAAKDFIDTVYDAAEEDAVSTSIIPYATQVNAGATLLSHWTRDDSHEHSHCVNFSTSDFNSAALPTTQTLEQTVDFDPWTDERGSFDLGEAIPKPVCPTDSDKDGDADREIMAWSTDKTALKAYVDNLSATGNTSTDIGTKWGAVMLDPSTQSVLTNMISTGNINAALDGRPFDYDDSDSMKILVVMTDGNNTTQYYMDDYRSGNSFVWRYEEAGTIHYSVWYDGESSTPITNPSGNYTYCADWGWGSCADWDYGSNPEFWFHARNPDQDRNDYSWRSTPYGGDDATRMTWGEVWSEIPPEYFSDEVLDEMGSMSSNERNRYEDAMTKVSSSTKNPRFDSICEVIKDNNVIIFTIGLEVSSSNAGRLEDCSSSISHYYDVDTLDIDDAFQSIASQINQLRLVQ